MLGGLLGPENVFRRPSFAFATLPFVLHLRSPRASRIPVSNVALYIGRLRD